MIGADTVPSEIARRAAVPLTSAALGPTIVEPEEGFTPEGVIDLGMGFDGREERPRFLPHQRALAVGHWRLLDVVLDPPTALVFSAGTPVEATRYVVFPAEEAQARLRLNHAGPLEPGRTFQGFNRIADNHFHWLTQCVPAIASYARDPGFVSGRLLLPPLSAPQERALALSGVALPERVTIASPRPVRLADLTFSTLLTGHDAPSPFCGAVFDRMATALGPTPRRYRRLYVWRVDSAARRMTNEDDLVELLARHDVEPVVLTGLSLDEQIRLFREASLVIGPHGAGLANIVFCRPGSVVYELLPDHYVNPCFNLLAQMRGLTYVADLHRAGARPGLWRHQTPWTVDLAAFERRLTAILSAQRGPVASRSRRCVTGAESEPEATTA